MKRVAVGGFHHETNSFMDGSTGYDYFESHRDRPPLVRGQDVLKWLAPETGSFALSGFLGDTQNEFEIVPLVWGSGGAGATVTAEAFERISAEMVARISDALPVDAVYLDLHGAMVTEDFEDGEGELLRRVRRAVGEKIPVVASLDYHANVTAMMVQSADALVAYRTYPHVDRVRTGKQAAAVLKQILKDGRPAGRVLRKAPFLIPLNSQSTLVHPSSTVVHASTKEIAGVYCVSYLAGFPSSDLAECGPSALAYAKTQALAEQAADELEALIEKLETDFSFPLLDERQAIEKAMAIARSADKPVVIADTQDNPGCGGTSDTTGVLAELLRHDVGSAVLGLFCDADAATAAHLAGVGSEITLALGGRHGPAPVVPLHQTFTVAALGDGKFATAGKVTGKRQVDLGPMALLRIGAVDVVVTSKRMQSHDLAPYQHVGVNVSDYKIVVVKSTCHFRAEFEPLAAEVLVTISPGAFAAYPSQLPYKRLRAGVRRSPKTA